MRRSEPRLVPDRHSNAAAPVVDIATAFRLARWLGPWADGSASPRDVAVEDVHRDGTAVRWYRPTAVASRGTVFLVPGLHPDGPADPRMDRFARVFAASGRTVAAPFLSDYLDLCVTTDVFGQAEAAYRAVLEADDRPAPDPLVFSISFGSLPAFHLAASALGARVRSLVVFGGYADWQTTVRFALTGVDSVTGEARSADPLNKPAVFTNLVGAIPDMRDLAPDLLPAWRTFCERTWGRPEMKEETAYTAVAREIAATLPERVRSGFLIGCGVEGGGTERCIAALEQGDWDHLDPLEAMARVRCPVRVIHGVDDDVIPHTQVERIVAGLPSDGDVAAYRTGLYGHTGSSSVDPRALAGELLTMVRVLRAMAA